MLEVESAATDALCVVVAMVMMDFVLDGVSDLSRPVVALTRELGVGLAVGVAAAALLIPLIPPLRDKPHGFTIFLASMLAIYALTQHWNGNGAVAVLTAALLLGNAASIVPRLFPGARAGIFTSTNTVTVMQDQLSFLIKSFFFFLIGLMFPTDPRLIALGAAGVVFLLLFRVPAVALATHGLGLKRKHFLLLVIAIPRGLAAGVLATLPLSRGIPDMENLAPALFALIVFSILFFAIGFYFVSHMPDEPDSPA